jgi:short-subunit dehydrogenase
VVLTSRRGLAAEGAPELVSELEKLGCGVDVVACDVSDRDAVAALVAEHAPDAVVHAAGVAPMCELVALDASEAEATIAAKVDGARHLDELCGDLDAFVVFSSNAGVWGSAGQAAYAAGNAYLDALVASRRACGQAGTSVAWGVWGGGGLAAAPGASEALRRHGVLTMAPERAIRALVDAVGHDDEFVAVADVDWNRFAPSFTAARPRPLIAAIPEARAALEEPVASEHGDTDTLRQRLASSSPDQQLDVLVELVCTTAAAVLGYSSQHPIGPNRSFSELGFDSLTAVELSKHVAAATALSLPPSLVFDHPTPTQLATSLRADMFGSAHSSTGGGGGGPAVAGFAELERLEDALESGVADDIGRERLTSRLRALLDRLEPAGQRVERSRSGLDSASDDELFEFIHRELGR